MLRLVALVDQWRAIEQTLPEGWADVRLRLEIADDGDCDHAAALLGPLNPGRHGKIVSFAAVRRGSGHGPELVRRLLARIDAEHIDARLTTSRVFEAPTAPPPEAAPLLAESWSAQVAALPEDWSDLYVELELLSSDYLDRAALLLAPLNPARFGTRLGFRFRVARKYGYGGSPEMTRRCLERLDAGNIRGEIRILRALSDTRPVQTQGPVWYVGGRSV